MNMFKSKEPAEPAPVGFGIRVRGQLWWFAPTEDITAHELAQVFTVMSTFLTGSVLLTRQMFDVDGWWDAAGPGVHRHFTPKSGE